MTGNKWTQCTVNTTPRPYTCTCTRVNKKSGWVTSLLPPSPSPPSSPPPLSVASHSRPTQSALASEFAHCLGTDCSHLRRRCPSISDAVWEQMNLHPRGKTSSFILELRDNLIAPQSLRWRFSLCPSSSPTFGIQLQDFVWRTSCSSPRYFVCASLGFSSPGIFSLTGRDVGSTDLQRPNARVAKSQLVNHPDCGRSVRLDDHMSNQM